MNNRLTLGIALLAVRLATMTAAEIEPTWESMAVNYRVPDWFVACPWKTFGEGPLKVKDGRQGENHNDFSPQDIRFTTKDGVLYVFVLAPLTEDIVIKTLATGGLLKEEVLSVVLMGSNEKIQWKRSPGGLAIQLPTTLPALPVVGFTDRGINRIKSYQGGFGSANDGLHQMRLVSKASDGQFDNPIAYCRQRKLDRIYAAVSRLTVK